MQSPPGVPTTRRGGLETRRGRILLSLLVAALLSLAVGILVAIAVALVAICLAMLLGFELSRPVAERAWLERLWAILVYALCLAPLASLVGIVIFSYVPLEVTMPSGKRESMDVLLIMVGGWLGAAACVVASLHILRRRGPKGILRPLRHFWVLVLLSMLTLFIVPILLPIPGFLWGLLALGLVGGAIFWTARPHRRPDEAGQTPTPVPAAFPTFETYRGN